jgi:hypothetical protein
MRRYGIQICNRQKVKKEDCGMQTRRLSCIEVSIDFFLSLLTNIGAQMLFYGALATAGRSLTLAGLVLGLAIPRRYATRRLFNALLLPGQRQPQWHSGLEVGVDTILAILVAMMLQWVVYGAAATWAKAGGLTMAVYAFTIGRRYFMRRLFEMWGARQERRALYTSQSLSTETS